MPPVGTGITGARGRFRRFRGPGGHVHKLFAVGRNGIREGCSHNRKFFRNECTVGLFIFYIKRLHRYGDIQCNRFGTVSCEYNGKWLGIGSRRNIDTGQMCRSEVTGDAARHLPIETGRNGHLLHRTGIGLRTVRLRRLRILHARTRCDNDRNKRQDQ